MIKQIKLEAQQKLKAKNIAPLLHQIHALPSLNATLQIQDCISLVFDTPLSPILEEQIYQCATALKPWRKGPFQIDKLYIDSEWKSFMKWNLLTPHINLNQKDVADIGCNNGYYMFQMLSHNPASLTGFDPYALFKCQFDFINHFAKTSIQYELLGVEHLEFYPQKFDVIFCMGVLYHRIDPIGTLKTLYKSLKSGGEAILDTLILDTQEQIALCPQKSYAKMSNTYFIPSPSALSGWCERAGFESVELFATSKTQTNEQRKTQWIDTMSLENFLDPKDENLTIEGYQAPFRGYFKLKRK